MTSMVCGKQAASTKTLDFDLLTRRAAVHRFGGGGRFVEQGGVGEFKAGKIDHHLLVVEQCFQSPLRDFGLMTCRPCIPARVFQHIAQDDLGCQRSL